MVAPVAGSTPMMKPITLPRMMGMRDCCQSARVGNTLVTLATGRATLELHPPSTSPSPNSATVNTINSTPSNNQTWPKSKRGTPTCGSMPMVPKASPASPVISPLSKEPPTAASAIRPSSTKEKYSGGPKASAIFANAGAIRISPIVPMVPAMKLPMAEMPSAAPARPCKAI